MLGGPCFSFSSTDPPSSSCVTYCSDSTLLVVAVGYHPHNRNDEFTIFLGGPSQFQSVPGCFGQFTNNGQLVMIGYAFLLYSVVATMVLCIYFGVRMFWSSRQSPLIKIFYRDGTFYFVVLALMSVANGVAAVFLPAGYRFILAPPQAVLHSTLSIRMVLHLRQQARCEMGLSTVRRIVHGKNPDPKLMMMSVPTHPKNEASSSHLDMGLVPRSPQFKE
ncbi:hypothetical protein BKA70DRAFT_1434313 [Coprinopsis sp. MPI-PUGE-AT-0042]|nr:hypothetical protein BKA70DRAFT_1434313 [Coprinopsis sp. MPI-PUGE-AT-0042]